MLKPEDLIEHVSTVTDFLNIKYFDGSLRYQVQIAERHSVKRYARVLANINSPDIVIPVIELDPIMIHANTLEIDLIVSHELVHVVQAHLRTQLGHGKSFKEIIRKFGLPTELSSRCAPPSVRSHREMKKGVVIVP